MANLKWTIIFLSCCGALLSSLSLGGFRPPRPLSSVLGSVSPIPAVFSRSARSARSEERQFGRCQVHAVFANGAQVVRWNQDSYSRLEGPHKWGVFHMRMLAGPQHFSADLRRLTLRRMLCDEGSHLFGWRQAPSEFFVTCISLQNEIQRERCD